MLVKNDRLDAAIVYVKQRKWEVFPVPPGTKAGYSVQRRNFDNGAPWGKTKSEAEVRKYWRRLPNANVGVPMGAGSGIFDIECDTVEGHSNLAKDGAPSLTELEAKHGRLPATLTFVSPTGSVHRLFNHPGGDVRIRSGPLDKDEYPGVDIRGDGAMAIAPPSRTSRGTYRWINRRRIAAAPEWVLAMVRKPEYAPREHHGEPADIAQLTLAMAMIPNPDCGWEDWNRVAMALHRATCGSPEGFKLFNAWSARSSKYDAGETARRWQAIDGCPPNQIGAGTVFFLAEQGVPDYLGRCIAQEPDVIALLREFHKLLGEP
jgi:hypothetical protein